MANIAPVLCDREQSCLLVIDIQQRLTAAIAKKVTAQIIRHTNILLSAAKTLAVPVIATAQYPKGLGAIEPAIADNLPSAAQYFEKTCFSCLDVVALKQYLTELNRKQVIVTGIEAHICVLQTASALIAAGYDVFVVTDAIASRHVGSYQSALVRLNSANLVTTEAVLFEWLRDAAHPAFKSLSQLIV